MSAYQIKPVDLPNDKDIVVKLWESNFDENVNFSYKYDWLYKDNPFKNAYLYFLECNEKERVGVQGVSSRIFEFNNKNISAGIVADFAVNKNHRSLGPGLSLLKKVQESGLSNNDLLYIYPNKKAEPVIKRAGYKNKKIIERFVRVSKTKVFLSQVFPKVLSSFLSYIIDPIIFIVDFTRHQFISINYMSELIDSVPIDIDDIWNNADFKYKVILAKRDKKFIEWRKKEFDIKSSLFVLRSKQDNQIIGYIAYLNEINNGTVKIIDMFFINETTALRALLVSFNYKARVLKSNSISVEGLFSKQIKDVLKKLGYKSRESRILYYKFNSKLYEVDSTKQIQWFLTSWDEDAV